MPDPITAIVGGAGLVGSLVGAKGQSDAAKTAANSADAANQLQYQMYQQQRQDLAPWTQAGESALNALMTGQAETWDQFAQRFTQPVGRDWTEQERAFIDNAYKNYKANLPQSQKGLIPAGPGEFTESPSYQFALDQGLQAQQRAASATGRLGSGAYLKDATQYAKNLASEEYQNFLNRYYQSLEPYFRVAGLGTSTANTLSSAGQNYATQAGNYMTQAGQAQAAGQLGQANTLANMFNWGGQQYANYAYGQQYQNQNALNNYWSNNAYTPGQMNQMLWL